MTFIGTPIIRVKTRNSKGVGPLSNVTFMKK
jgi:hypothetical protein